MFVKTTGVLLGTILVLTACGPSRGAGESDDASSAGPAATGEVLRIAEQHGIAYAPLALMQIEDRIDAEWYRMANATVIREAMLAGRLDVGSMGIPPYLIGRDRGTDWEVLAGVSEVPVALVTLRSDLMTFTDLTEAERIALPQPGSIQHILLAMAAYRVWGDPRRFDARLLSLSHPDGMAALLSRREIDAHFTTPPYLFEELAMPGARVLLDGREAFGGRFTFIVSVVAPGETTAPREAAIARYRQVLAAATEDLTQLQVQLRGGDRPVILQKLAEHYGLDPEDLADQLARPEVVYSADIRGLETFAEAMREFGYVR